MAKDIFDVAMCEEMIALWLEAYKAAASGKSYSIDGVSLTRQDLPEIRKSLHFWRKQLAIAEGRAVSDVAFRQAYPVDSWAPPFVGPCGGDEK